MSHNLIENPYRIYDLPKELDYVDVHIILECIRQWNNTGEELFSQDEVLRYSATASADSVEARLAHLICFAGKRLRQLSPPSESIREASSEQKRRIVDRFFNSKKSSPWVTALVDFWKLRLPEYFFQRALRGFLHREMSILREAYVPEAFIMIIVEAFLKRLQILDTTQKVLEELKSSEVYFDYFEKYFGEGNSFGDSETQRRIYLFTQRFTEDLRVILWKTHSAVRATPVSG